MLKWHAFFNEQDISFEKKNRTGEQERITHKGFVFYHTKLANSDFWPEIRRYSFKLSALLQHMTPWGHILLNRVSLMSSSLPHRAVGLTFSERRVNPCSCECAVIRQRQKPYGDERPSRSGFIRGLDRQHWRGRDSGTICTQKWPGYLKTPFLLSSSRSLPVYLALL